MSELLNIILEKYKAKSGDEQNFMDKHTDNVEVTSAPGADDTKPKNQKVDRKKNRQGYEPEEDEEMYEDVEIDIDDILEAFYGEQEEELTEEEEILIREMLSTQEGTDELLSMIFEEEDEDMEDDEEDEEEDEDEEDMEEASCNRMRGKK